MSHNELFETYDLNLTACLVALGYTIDTIKKEGTRCLFLFKKTDHLKESISDYWKQEIVINPHTLFDALKFIKSRIYAGDVN